jgi:hypothetical protein
MPRQPQDQGKDDADEDACRDRRVEGEIIVADLDVAGKPTKANTRKPRPDQPTAARARPITINAHDVISDMWRLDRNRKTVKHSFLLSVAVEYSRCLRRDARTLLCCRHGKNMSKIKLLPSHRRIEPVSGTVFDTQVIENKRSRTKLHACPA